MKRRSFLQALVTAIAALPVIGKARERQSTDLDLAWGRHPDCGGPIEHKVIDGYPATPDEAYPPGLYGETVVVFEAAEPIKIGQFCSLSEEGNARPAKLKTDWIIGMAYSNAQKGEPVKVVTAGWRVDKSSYSMYISQQV